MTLVTGTVSLSAGDLDRYRAVLSSLLAPAAWNGTEAWAEGVLRTVTELFGSDRGFLLLPTGPGGEPGRLYGHNLEPDCVEALARFAPTDDAKDETGFKDPAHARAMRRLAAAGVRVWNPAVVERLTRVKFTAMERFYPEVVLGWGVKHFGTAALWLPEGPVLLSYLPRRPEGTRFGEAELVVLSLLVPALEAGVSTVRALGERRRGIGKLLDEMDAAALVRFADGDTYRNHRLRSLLNDPAHRETLVQAMNRLAEQVLRLQEPERKSTTAPSLDTGSHVFELDGERFYLHASWLPPETVGVRSAVLVLVRGPSTRLPEARVLERRYGLTPRQAQVARLLATGVSNRQIGDRLGISPHTARHHAQSVLERVGAPTRKALGLRFLTETRQDG